MRPAVFFDRDGTLIEGVPYLADPERVVLHGGVVEALRALEAAGFLRVLVTNQAGIGRGLIPFEAWEAVQARLAALLAAEGVALDAVYFCPHHPTEARGELLRACECRKPNPGMLEAAMREHGIDRSRSFLVGDAASDIGAGKNAGVRTILVRTGYGEEVLAGEADPVPDHVARDAHEAVMRFVLGRG